MKIALYIEDGLEQIVLTPQSITEKVLLGRLHDETRRLTLQRGKFYACQGDWTLQGSSGKDEDVSTIIVLRAGDTV